MSTRLHVAAYSGNVDEARKLLKHGWYDVNCTNEDGRTPLHEACWRCHVDMVMHLSICCPTLPLLGCTGDLPGDLTQDFPPGVGNLTVKSLMLPRGSIEMYTGFDALAHPL